MAHSPTGSLPDWPALPQTKTLWISTHSSTAILFEPRADGVHQERHVFADPHLALNWCLGNGAAFYLQNDTGDPRHN